ncbi:MAG: hypothetical protein KAG66_18525, partial [Methylococcales bacterium]|nr:hypothetical protein [Methylococcales bacterium]
WLEWRYSSGNWAEEAVETQECAIASTTEAVECQFTTEQGGQYRISATISDAQGRPNSSQITRYVSGGRARPNRNIEKEAVIIIPDRDGYAPGDSAEILIIPPFTPAEGLLTVTRGDILYTERFQVTGDSHVLGIDLTEQHLPNLNIQVDLVGAAVRTSADGTELPDLPSRPAYASGTASLSVSTASRELSLDVQLADAALAPGGSTTMDVIITNADSSPVANSEVAVVIVDEAVLALSNYQFHNPVISFYQSRWSRLESRYGRANIVLANVQALADQDLEQAEVLEKESGRLSGAPGNTAAPMVAEESIMAFDSAESADMDDGAAASEAAPAIRLRSNFDPLATFAPTVMTDAQGRATVTVDLPDNLTRYRVMVAAVAVAGDEKNLFGSAETSLIARLPLMV